MKLTFKLHINYRLLIIDNFLLLKKKVSFFNSSDKIQIQAVLIIYFQIHFQTFHYLIQPKRVFRKDFLFPLIPNKDLHFVHSFKH